MSNSLRQLQNNYDFILLDCPPIVGVLMINALAACDLLLIPVRTEFLALHGLFGMIETIKMVKKSQKINLDYLIVPTMFDRRTKAAHNTLQQIRQKFIISMFGIPLFLLIQSLEMQVKIMFYLLNTLKQQRVFGHIIFY